MTELTTNPNRLDSMRAGLDAFIRRNANALILGCMLGAALAVWMVPAAAETRCMMVKQQGLGLQGALSLSIVLTALAWRTHKPALRFLASRRRGEGTSTDA